MAELVAQCYMDLTAFGKASANIVGREIDVNPLRMQMLGERLTEVTKTLTWDVLASINKSWGENTTISYTDVNSTYVWNPTTGVFSITNSAGTVTTLTGIYTIEALEISQDVIPLISVILQVIDCTNADIFLIGSLSSVAKTSQVENIDWGTSEYLAVGTQHALFSKISNSADSEYGLMSDTVLGSEPEFTNLLLQSGGVWKADNIYPLDLISQDVNLSSSRSDNSRTAKANEDNNYLMIAAFAASLLSGDPLITYEPTMLKEWIYSLPSDSRIEKSRAGVYMTWDYLMIAAFAMNLLSGDSKVCYEPWMLWKIFEWYFSSSSVVANSRKIFDLSPRWG